MSELKVDTPVWMQMERGKAEHKPLSEDAGHTEEWRKTAGGQGGNPASASREVSNSYQEWGWGGACGFKKQKELTKLGRHYEEQ